MNDIKEKSPQKSNEEKTSFATFFWNPRSKEFCGRTATSWGKIILFYTIFYLCLAAFWAIMLLIFKTTIDDKEPKWKLEDSRIGANPGLGFRPRPPADRIESTLIRFRRSKEDTYKHWVSDLKTFIEPYSGNAVNFTDGKSAGGADHPIDCEQSQLTSPNQFCEFDIRAIDSECSAARDFGYKEGKPCVLIKLNRIFDWKPEPYKFEDLNDPKLPEELRAAMDSVKSKRGPTGEYVFVTCNGQNSLDKEHIGAVDYYPQQGIRTHFFPFRNQDNYRSPFVFVRFSSPTNGMIINVECKAWAKNIRHSALEKEGSVIFELSIE
ncbi:sodium/potassium-transporting ATPase subunit beta-like [Brevipalpus obovatus]|uniref:sodium/potassium-transporting ATPase subunit beta-like n=1 Tax=Brevipalpus obovatus TaxID=246614 RepID=UPI003D9F51BA